MKKRRIAQLTIFGDLFSRAARGTRAFRGNRFAITIYDADKDCYIAAFMKNFGNQASPVFSCTTIRSWLEARNGYPTEFFIIKRRIMNEKKKNNEIGNLW